MSASASASASASVSPIPETMIPETMTTDELAQLTDVPTDLVLAILDAGLFGEMAQMVHDRPAYLPGAIEVIWNIAELADELDAGRCSSFTAWFLLRFGLKPEPVNLRPAIRSQ